MKEETINYKEQVLYLLERSKIPTKNFVELNDLSLSLNNYLNIKEKNSDGTINLCDHVEKKYAI